jgi:ArsR family transcriptional regulator, arsenate/arsenite/antimonite-responsive transcriptional repressor
MTLRTSNILFRAFADASRLRILNLLLEGELCVCELCDALNVLQPRISRHLAYLKRAGLVSVRSEGKWKHYALTDGAGGLHSTLLHCLQSCLRDVDVLQRDVRRLQTLRKRCPCVAVPCIAGTC